VRARLPDRASEGPTRSPIGAQRTACAATMTRRLLGCRADPNRSDAFLACSISPPDAALLSCFMAVPNPAITLLAALAARWTSENPCSNVTVTAKLSRPGSHSSNLSLIGSASTDLTIVLCRMSCSTKETRRSIPKARDGRGE
jgi:hypothetical protein